MHQTNPSLCLMACEESLVEEYVLCQVHYEIFYYSCHLQFAIWCWYLYFPSISKLRNTQVQVWINLTKCWNLRPDAKYRNNLKEPYRNDKSSLHPCQSGMKCSWMAHKASFLKRSSYAIVAIIRLSCKWASVSRFLYSDWMYNTMHENVASHTYVDPNCTRAFVASFFKHANFFGAFNQKLAKWASSNWIFGFYLPGTLPPLKRSHHKPQHQLEMETEHVDTTSLPVQGSVLWNLLCQVLNEILLYAWKWHLTIRCCKKFRVVWKQTKITSFCSRDENSQLVNKTTNGSLQFKHPFASTLQWNIQLIQFLKNISQERKASNEQIIWKKLQFHFSVCAGSALLHSWV